MDSSGIIAIALLLLVVGLMVFRNMNQYDLEAAQKDLREGAALIDVRSEGEYAGGNVPGAVNIPLDRIVAGVEKRFPDKSRTLLLHCASGARSGSAVSQLKAAGYENVHNVGSFSRASKLTQP